MPRRPRAHERGLVVPPTSRPIPRTGREKKKRAADEDPDVPPLLGKHAGDLLALAGKIRACEACGRAQAARTLGTGHPRAPVFLVSEKPSASDISSGGAMTDEAPALEKAFAALDIPAWWTYGSTAVRCGDAAAAADEIAACSSHLLEEIEAIEPRVIVAFGAKAAAAIRALDGRCGLVVPDELPQGTATRLRPGLDLIVTEPLPEGTTKTDSKRRLWRDLRLIPALLRPDVGS